MSRMWRKGTILAFVLAAFAYADISTCACDPTQPATMEARDCGLCREAAKQPAEVPVFFLKDINPRKPNRWLALPRALRKGMFTLGQMTQAERDQLWSEAIRKAAEMWGDGWGLAYNGDLVRTQCHPHVHIGKLLKGIETDNFIVVEKVSEIPVPDGDGLWIHPAGNKLHVHLGEQICETVLLR